VFESQSGTVDSSLADKGSISDLDSTCFISSFTGVEANGSTELVFSSLKIQDFFSSVLAKGSFFLGFSSDKTSSKISSSQILLSSKSSNDSQDFLFLMKSIIQNTNIQKIITHKIHKAHFQTDLK